MSTCPACAASVVAEMRFCPRCGGGLPPSDATSAATESFAAAPGAVYKSSSAATAGDAGPRFLPGTVVAGRYRIVSLVGRGGMGEVYRADDLKLEQPVALKFLPPRLAADPAALARLYQEVRAARQVTDAHVCRVHDLGEHEAQPFLTMELIDGEDLASLLRRIGHLPEAKGVEVARQICVGLAAIHAAGLLHRDLKPANVMLDGRGRARITDLGLAGVAAEGRGVVAGTPAYMSPEQLAGGELTARSDLYALGLVLYELFTGHRAFAANDLGKLLRQHREGGTPPPSTVVPGLDPRIEAAIFACLAADPGRRPRSALAVSAALPGGDPLAAAIAAGETPSPEMVAAAGDAGGLSRGVALACLGAVLAALLAIAAMGSRGTVFGRVPHELPPRELARQARALLARLGHAAPPVDSAFGLHYDYELRNAARAPAEHPGAVAALESGRGGAIHLWYRESPWSLLPDRIHDASTRVSFVDPPREIPGMVGVEVDTQGRLLHFWAVPAADAIRAAPKPADWGPLFAAAGLDASRFRPTASRRTLHVPYDQVAAWQGSAVDLPGVPLVVEAAAFRGRPVAFELIAPWRVDGEPWQGWHRGKPAPAGDPADLIPVLAFLGGAWLARRNVRRGRGDRRGAWRLAGMVALASLLSMALNGGLGPSFDLLWARVGTAVLLGALTGCFYLAMEPYVRRRWPTRLISWSRLLAGQVHDPLVGRDLLAGVLCAVATVAVVRGVELLADHPSTLVELVVLLGPHQVADVLLSHFVVGLFGAPLLAFLLTVLRALLRHEVLAGAAVVLLFVLRTLPEPGLGDVLFVFVVCGWVVAFLRLGLLATAVYLGTAPLLVKLPLTLDPDSWYFGLSLAGLVPVLALALYGFRTAVVKEPFFRGDPLEA